MAERRRRALAGLLAAAALEACAAPAVAPRRDAAAASSGQPFTLAPGARATVASPPATVELRAVEADSRCARDVTCVWAGDAVVVVAVTAAGRQEVLRLHTNLEPKAAAVLGVELALVELAPYPESSVEIAPGDYRATLVARRAGE